MGNYRNIFCTCAIFFLLSISPEGEAWSIQKDYELLDESDSSSNSASSSSSGSSESKQENVNDNAIDVEVGKISMGHLLFPRFPSQIDQKVEITRREKLFQTKPTVDEIVHRTLAWSNSLGIRTHLVNGNGELLRRPNISAIMNSIMESNSHIKKDLTEEEEFHDFDYEDEESEEENVESIEESVHKTSNNIIIDKDITMSMSTSTGQDNNDVNTEKSSDSNNFDHTTTTKIPTEDISLVTNSLNNNIEDERDLTPDEHEEIMNLGAKLFAFGEHTDEDIRSFYNEMLTFNENFDEEEDIEYYDEASMGWPVVDETLTPSTHQNIEQMFTESPVSVSINPTESSGSDDESYWNFENKKLLDEDSGLVSVIQVFYPDAKIEMKAFAVGTFLSIGFCGIIFIMWKSSKKHKKLLTKSGGDGKILI